MLGVSGVTSAIPRCILHIKMPIKPGQRWSQEICVRVHLCEGDA